MDINAHSVGVGPAWETQLNRVSFVIGHVWQVHSGNSFEGVRKYRWRGTALSEYRLVHERDVNKVDSSRGTRFERQQG
jgi:hypothetical protein